MEKTQGIIESITEKDGRYCILIAGKKYSSFDKDVASKLQTGQNIRITYSDNKASTGITYHNIKELEIMSAMPSMPIDTETQRKYRAMCLSYAKDLVVAERIKLEKLLPIAKKMHEWVVKDD